MNCCCGRVVLRSQFCYLRQHLKAAVGAVLGHFNRRTLRLSAEGVTERPASPGCLPDRRLLHLLTGDSVSVFILTSSADQCVHEAARSKKSVSTAAQNNNNT